MYPSGVSACSVMLSIIGVYRLTGGQVSDIYISYTLRSLFIPALRDYLFPHVLRVTGIDHGDGVALDGVGIVPLIGVCHVIAILLPFNQGGLATQKRTFYQINTKHCILYITRKVIKVISMLVLLGHIIVKRMYLSVGQRLDDVLRWSHLRRLLSHPP